MSFYLLLYIIGALCMVMLPVLTVITVFRIMNKKPVVYFVHGMAFFVIFSAFSFILGYMLQTFKG